MSDQGKPVAHRTRSQLNLEFFEEGHIQHGRLESFQSVEFPGLTSFKWTVPMKNVAPLTSFDTLTIIKEGSDIVLSGLIGGNGKEMLAIRQMVLKEGEQFQTTPFSRARNGDGDLEVKGMKFGGAHLLAVRGL